MKSNKANGILEIDLLNAKDPPHKKMGKREFIKKLVEENTQLKSIISQMVQSITAIETQNKTLMQQLSFFNNMNSPLENKENTSFSSNDTETNLQETEKDTCDKNL